MPNRLRKLTLERVDLVDAGANLDKASGEGAHILLYKRAEVGKEEHGHARDFDQTMMEQKMRGMFQHMYDHVAALQESLGSIFSDGALAPEEKRAMAEGSMDQFSASLLSSMDDIMSERVEKIGRKISAKRLSTLKAMYAELKRIIREAEGGPMEKSEILKTLEKVEGGEEIIRHIEELEAKVAPAQEPEDVLKSLPPEVRERIEKAERRAAEAEALAKAERDARELERFQKRVSEFRALPLDKAKDAATLKALAEKAPEEWNRVEQILSAADEALAKSALFKELGRSGSGEGDSARERIEKLAAGLIAEGKAKNTPEAYKQIAKTNPDLYREYQVEVRKGVN